MGASRQITAWLGWPSRAFGFSVNMQMSQTQGRPACPGHLQPGLQDWMLGAEPSPQQAGTGKAASSGPWGPEDREACYNHGQTPTWPHCSLAPKILRMVGRFGPEVGLLRGLSLLEGSEGLQPAAVTIPTQKLHPCSWAQRAPRF